MGERVSWGMLAGGRDGEGGGNKVDDLRVTKLEVNPFFFYINY